MPMVWLFTLWPRLSIPAAGTSSPAGSRYLLAMPGDHRPPAGSWPSSAFPGHARGHRQLGAADQDRFSLPLGKLSTTQPVIWHLGYVFTDEIYECGHA